MLSCLAVKPSDCNGGRSGFSSEKREGFLPNFLTQVPALLHA